MISPRLADDASLDGDQSPTATRVTLRPHDPATGEEIDKREVVKGYEYARGEFVTFTAEELKALDVESPKIIDLEKSVPGGGIDPVYFESAQGNVDRDLAGHRPCDQARPKPRQANAGQRALSDGSLG